MERRGDGALSVDGDGAAHEGSNRVRHSIPSYVPLLAASCEADAAVIERNPEKIRQEEIQIILDLDPKLTAVYALASNVFYEVPGLLGSDLKNAEEIFRKGREQDPQFTAMRVGLGKTLLKLERLAEAQRELQAVLVEKQPR